MPRKTASSRPAKLPQPWRDCLMVLPGYDPFRDSDGFHFDVIEAQDRIDFFETMLTLTSTKGRPRFHLDPWQKAALANLFGWKDADGLRRYREALIYLARKNGKSNWAAAVALSVILQDREPEAEILIAAGNESQAGITFRAARSMVNANPKLRERLKVYEVSKRILWEETGSFIQALSSEADTKFGLNPHCIIIDELHIFDDYRLISALTSGQGARRQPLVLYTSQADFHRESPCNDKHTYACQVRDGLVQDPRFLPVVYELSRQDLEADPDCWKFEPGWRKANPSLGTAKTLDFMRTECAKAIRDPRARNAFKRFQLNIITDQSEVWLKGEDWQACGAPFDAEELQGQTCYAGVDLASRGDLCAAAFYFPDHEHRVLIVAWTHEAAVQERVERGLLDYQLWAEAGFLRVQEGNTVDMQAVEQEILELCTTYQVRALAIDPLNGLQMCQNFLKAEVNAFLHKQQTGSMNDGTQEVEQLVVGHKLRHGGNPLLTAHVQNVRVMQRHDGAVRPIKDTREQKIDCAVAMIMAVSASMLHKPEETDSVYNHRGIQMI